MYRLADLEPLVEDEYESVLPIHNYQGSFNFDGSNPVIAGRSSTGLRDSKADCWTLDRAEHHSPLNIVFGVKRLDNVVKARNIR
jgi:hypothetical protein